MVSTLTVLSQLMLLAASLFDNMQLDLITWHPIVP